MYDLIIRNGMVVDGTRAPAYQADVCIQNGVLPRLQHSAVPKRKR